MNATAQTKILAIKVKNLRNRIGKFNGCCPKDVLADKGEEFYRIWEDIFANECEFISREEAETSPEWKQVVPYFIFLNDNHVLTHLSDDGGEKEYFGFRAIGLGESIESSGEISTSEAYFTVAASRLHEKAMLQLDYKDMNSSFIGIVNDDTDEFGVARVGFVHLIMLNENERAAIEYQKRIPGIKFIELDDLDPSAEDFDLWSRHVVKLINREEATSLEMVAFLSEFVRLTTNIIHPAMCRINSTSVPINHLIDMEIKSGCNQLSELFKEARSLGLL